jgi:phage gp29-like protein
MFGWLTNILPTGKEKKSVFEKDSLSAWLEVQNPLRGLTVTKTVQIFDYARLGSYAELQWLYREIENADPILLTVSERRASSLLSRDWDIKIVDASKVRGYDETLADEQQGFLKVAYANAERGNLTEAIEHLSSAFFRGYAHVRPLYSAGMDGLDGFDILDNWNFCRDHQTGAWYWNPSAQSCPSLSSVTEIPQGELVSVVRTKHIDYPAMEIYIRRALGDKKYGIFLERYGIPPVIIIMPQDGDKTRETEYRTAAENVAKGGSGALPFGSEVNYATEARGADPFNAFLARQEKLIVLMATGGTLGSLASPTGIGGGASDIQDKAFGDIILRDCSIVASSMNRICTDALLNLAFPGRPHLARFEFSDRKPTAAQVFEDAGKAKVAGYTVAQTDLEERTGYTLEKDAALIAPSSQISEPGVLEAVPAEATTVSETALNGAQIQSIVELLSQAAAKSIPKESIMPILKASFPAVAEQVLQSIVAPLSGFVAAGDSAPVLNKTDQILNKEETSADKTPLQNDGSPLQNASKGEEGKTMPTKDAPPVEAILEGLAVETEKQLYGVFLDAAIEAAQKGKQP